MTRYVIYQIKNLLENKIYIGSTIQVDIRRRQHFNMLRKGEHHCKPLQNAFNKYGEVNFEFLTLEELDSQESMISRESELLNSTDNLYNVCLSATDSSGTNNSNYRHGKYMISACIKCGLPRKTLGKGICASCYFSERDISGSKNPFYGKTHSEESKRKQSEDKKGMKSKSPQCLPVQVDEIVYDSLGEASRAVGCSVATVYNRCKSDKFPNYKKV